MFLQVTNQLSHRLLGHLRPLGQLGHRCSVLVEVLEDRSMSRPYFHVPATGQVVEFTRSLYRGDAYDFAVELKLAPAPERSPS